MTGEKSKAQVVDEVVISQVKDVSLLQWFSKQHRRMMIDCRYNKDIDGIVYHETMRTLICQRIVQIWNEDKTIAEEESIIMDNYESQKRSIRIKELLKDLTVAKNRVKFYSDKGNIKAAEEEAITEYRIRERLEKLGWTGIE